MSAFDDHARRGGILARCEQRGLTLLARSPLGGPRGAARLARHPALAPLAAARGASPAELALAWLLACSSAIVALPGAGRPSSARSAARAARIELDGAALAALDAAFGTPRPPSRCGPHAAARAATSCSSWASPARARRASR